MAEPKTLQEAVQYFSSPDNCINYVVVRRWPNGVTCPTCGRSDVRFISTRRMWECKAQHPRKQFSVKIGTIFEDSPLPLDTWLCAMWLIVSCKNGISSYEVSRDLGIAQKSAWHMMHRIRLALHNGTLDKLSGEVEVDETFIGGKARNMHRKRRAKMLGTNNGIFGKIAVQGLLERHGGKVHTRVVGRTQVKPLLDGVFEHVETGSTVYTDEAMAYDRLGLADYTHKVIKHAEVRGRANSHQHD